MRQKQAERKLCTRKEARRERVLRGRAALASGVRHSAPPPKPTSLGTFLFGDKKVTPPHARTNTELFRSMQHFSNRDQALQKCFLIVTS